MFAEGKKCFEKVGVKLTQLMIVGQTGTVQRENSTSNKQPIVFEGGGGRVSRGGGKDCAIPFTPLSRGKNS